MAKNRINPALSKSAFAESILSISTRFPLGSVFEDFLIMSIAACTQNVETGKSWYEEEYLATIDKYKDSELRYEFPKAFGALVIEMEERITSSLGNDILGEFFESHISNGRNGQFFTPQPVCDFMASITANKDERDAEEEKGKPLRILDPACGSGRMLISSSRRIGPGHEYYGIDIDRMCVKICALNLFLNGVWNSEVMCANALSPDDFVIAYRISFLPLGIFKIEDKEESKLWHLHNASFKKNVQKPFKPSPPTSEDSTQLNLF